MFQSFCLLASADGASVLELVSHPPYEAMSIMAFVLVFGWMVKAFTGQPMVVGATFGGFLIGPTVFGALFPELFGEIFNPITMAFLIGLTSMGLAFYQGITGLDFDPSRIQGGKTVVVTTVAGLVAPFALGIPVSYGLYELFCDHEKIQFWPFALYTSAGLTITSIVVASYILKKTDLSKSMLAATVVAVAALDDASGWVLVSFIDAFAKKGNVMEALPAVAAIFGFIAVMIVAVRPLLLWLLPKDPHDERVTGIYVILTLIVASISHHLGIHALFGSFVLGAIFPKTPQPSSKHDHNYSDVIAHKIELFQEMFFVPLFLAVSGLRTNLLSVFMDPWAIGAAIVVTIAAVAAKWGACSLAANACGVKWADAKALGWLLNGRGLMGLMIINLAYSAGMYDQKVFSIMVLVGLATTAMTYPGVIAYKREVQNGLSSDSSDPTIENKINDLVTVEGDVPTNADGSATRHHAHETH